MELTATTMISLDGVTQGPGGPEEDTSGGFDLGGWPLNSLPKHVVSTTLTELSWPGASLIEGDPIEAIAQLKRRPGRELQIHGSVVLTQSLLAAGLIDRHS